MKLMISAVMVIGGLAAAAPAMAQKEDLTGWYGSLGYANQRSQGTDLGAAIARFGNRLNPYVGLEGDLAVGIDTGVTPQGDGARLNRSIAGYVVGYMPLAPKVDLLARIGYGQSRYSLDTAGQWSRSSLDSINYGVGAQYRLNPDNGLRLDYTRKDFTHSEAHANDWMLSFVHRF